MKRKSGTAVRDRTTVSVYPEPALYKKLSTAAANENRSLGNMAGEILERYLNGICIRDAELRLLLEGEARDREWTVETMAVHILQSYFRVKTSTSESAAPIGSGG